MTAGDISMEVCTEILSVGCFLSRNFVILRTDLNNFDGLLCPMFEEKPGTDTREIHTSGPRGIRVVDGLKSWVQNYRLGFEFGLGPS